MARPLFFTIACRQFQLADDMIDLAKQGDAEAAKAVEPLLRDVLQQNIKLEATVKQCLGLAA